MEIKDVKYLALEGGGGKGVTYLGAVAALEELKVLPINIRSNQMKIDAETKSIDKKKTTFNRHYFGQNQIEGISGSSAGAITALCLAMGMNLEELTKVLKTKVTYWNKNISVFDSFFDFNTYTCFKKSDIDGVKGILPKKTNYYVRCVNMNSRGSYHKKIFYGPDKPLIGGIKQFFTGWLKGLGKTFAGAERKSNPILNAMWGFPTVFDYLSVFQGNDLKFDLHLKGLLHGGGLFPGFNARRFIRKLIKDNLIDNPEIKDRIKVYNEKIWIKDKGNRRQSSPNEKNRFYNKIDIDNWGDPENHITFEQFYFLTGVDLVLTGTNITNGIPLYFSKERTPDFPVADAVAISMNLPIIFTPIWNEGPVYIDYEQFYKKLARKGMKSINKDWTKYTNMYKGLYIDGGVTNNLPLHSFDDIEDPFSNFIDPRNPLKNLPANSGVLALRLTEGKPTIKSEGNVDISEDFAIGINGKNTLNTALFYSEYGQVLSKDEIDQCIHLYTYDLETTIFAPNSSLRKEPIIEAYFDVISRFDQSPPTYQWDNYNEYKSSRLQKTNNTKIGKILQTWEEEELIKIR